MSTYALAQKSSFERMLAYVKPTINSYSSSRKEKPITRSHTCMP